MKKSLYLLAAGAAALTLTVPGMAIAGEAAGNDTLNVVVTDDASQFNPGVTNTYSDIMSLYQIYERLVYYIDGEPVPQLAESWEASEKSSLIRFI